MSIAHLLTEFSNRADEEPEARFLSELELEEERLAAFERGYSAGWDDALKAHSQERIQATAELRQCLEDIAFTYHEAHTQMMVSLREVIAGLISTVLPRVLRATLASRLSEETADLIEANVDMPIEISISPNMDDDWVEIIDAFETAPLVALRDDDLKPGQIVLRVGIDERELDLDGLLDRIARCIDGFFEHSDPEVTHG